MNEAQCPWGLIIGASEGIGAAFARELAARKIKLLLVARRKGPLDKLKRELETEFQHIEVATLPLDMEMRNAFDVIESKTVELEIDCFIYNAGAETLYSDFIDQSWDFIAGRMQRNFFMQVRLTHHFARKMCERGRGDIILMGSISGYLGSPGFAMYGANKAFVHNLSEALWSELGKHNVNLLCSAIGPTDTPAMRKSFGDLESPADPIWVARRSLEKLGKQPIWIADDIKEHVERFQRMDPSDRARFGEQMMEAFVKQGAHVKG